MKKTTMIVMLIVVLVLQSVLPIAYADTQFYDTLYEQGNTRGNRVPSSSHSLPYTGSWNSVSSYTNTNYYFTGRSKFDISVNVRMNYSGTTGRFKVYLVDLDSSADPVCVLDSGTAKFSYSDSTTQSVNSSHRYYLKFTITNNTRSCSGSMRIDKG